MDDILDKFRHLQTEMELLFDDFFRVRHPFALSVEKKWRPPVDVYETEAEVVLVAELAGVSREEVNIDAAEEAVYLSGTRKEAERVSKKHYHSMEIRFGPFEKLIRLPAKVNIEKMEITLENGLLEVRFPKVGKPKEVIVEID